MSVDDTRLPERRSGSSGQCSEISRGRRRLLLTLGAGLTLGACGRKGDLELPPPPPAEPVLRDETGAETE